MFQVPRFSPANYGLKFTHTIDINKESNNFSFIEKIKMPG